MPEEIQEQKEIKEYLLGFITLEEARERVEERMMLDEKYYEEVLSVEEDLIQNYIDGDLSREDKKAFERSFLMSDERREQIKFARAFRKCINAQEGAEKGARKIPERKWNLAGLFSFSQPLGFAGAAAGILIAVLAGYFGWNFYSQYSERQQVLASLNKAYRSSRPLESRISEMDYAQFNKLRSDDPSQIDRLALSSAEGQISKNATTNPSASNLVLAGNLYLAKKEFDTAIEQFEKARLADPNDPSIFSGLGVAYREKGAVLGVSDDKGKKGKALEFYSEALENIDKALQFKPGMLEARFNRGLVLEAIGQKHETKKAWEEYLQYDASSPWAEEARRHLQDLDLHSVIEIKDEELLRAFQNSRQNTSEDETFQLISRNRELIEKKYLPQKIAMSIVHSDGEARVQLLGDLAYLGELEKKRNNDTFAADLHDLYSHLPKEKIETLQKAQQAMADGYQLLKEKEDFSGAIVKLNEAYDLFIKSGNRIEADTICKHFIGYSFYNSNRRKEANDLFREIEEYSTEKGYKWFSLMNHYWYIYTQKYLGYVSTTESIEMQEASLRDAEALNDVYMQQKFLTALVAQVSDVRDKNKTFSNLAPLLKLSSGPGLSARQIVRNLDDGIKAMADNGYPAASRALVQECLAFAEVNKTPIFATVSLRNAAVVNIKIKNFQEAEDLLDQARKNETNIKEEARHNVETGKNLLVFGDLETSRQKYASALNYYDEALKFLERTEDRISMYSAKKAKLQMYKKLGYQQQVENELVSTLEITEKFRQEFTSENDRMAFFNIQQEVYDTGIDIEYGKNNAEQAFNYAEKSNSRSLLDWLHRKAGKLELAEPLEASQIKANLPSNVQVLQYAVLNDKVVIWIVSKERLTMISAKADSGELKKKIEYYVKLIKTQNKQAQAEINDLSRELYALLIGPALPYLSREQELCIVPNKALFYLPFASLTSKDGTFLIEQFSFFYSPSSNVLLLSTEQARKRNNSADESLLSVGNPAFDQVKRPDLADLKESAIESREIARDYSKNNQKILQGHDATKQEFLKAVVNADVMHFAGHYVVNPTSPILSELVMAKTSDDPADNSLKNYELKNLDLPRTKLVVLSACQTGVEGYYDGEGLVGLSRTFLSLGVPVVVASQWPVDSGATALLMKKFHKLRKQDGLSTVHALQSAQLEMLRVPDSQYRSPFYWASFASFGGYAEF